MLYLKYHEYEVANNMESGKAMTLVSWRPMMGLRGLEKKDLLRGAEDAGSYFPATDCALFLQMLMSVQI